MTHQPIQISNSIRLTGRQWLGIGLFAILVAFFGPSLWEYVEPFPDEADFRMPDDLKTDYWLYQRWARLAADKHKVMVIGDSVIWGLFSRRAETLSHYLNVQDEEIYANLGLNAAHPLALEGLVRHYGSSISGKEVLLHCNLLWLTELHGGTSRRTRRTETRMSSIRVWYRNSRHAWPATTMRYFPSPGVSTGRTASANQPVGEASARGCLPYRAPNKSQDYSPGWTLEHPYDNPFEPLTRGLPVGHDELMKPQQPWFKDRRNREEDFPWVDLETSLQWAAFQRLVDLLRSRGNRVFVLVGPFNEYRLTKASKDKCQEVKNHDCGLAEGPRRWAHMIADRDARMLSQCGVRRF